VFDQDEAIKVLADSIKLSRAGLRDPEKPIGSYLFCGPTGVGKTEVARQYLARIGYDPAMGARPLTRIIQDAVKRPLAEELLFGKLAHGGLVSIGFDGTTLTFDFKEDKAVKSAKRDSEIA
jgi:ATP-dependent Clp protease ATP-binding subunit ClpA